MYFGSQCSKMSKLILVVTFLPSTNIKMARRVVAAEAIQWYW